TVPADLSLGVALRALFPCGSITGAPKRRTMQIIEELEDEPRGVYTGAVGYARPDGDFAFNVPIRTVVSTEDGRGELGLGSGILHEADAGAEYAECLLKGRFLTGVNAKFDLVESLRYASGEAAPDHLARHLERLERSARFFGFAFDRAHVT